MRAVTSRSTDFGLCDEPGTNALDFALAIGQHFPSGDFGAAACRPIDHVLIPLTVPGDIGSALDAGTLDAPRSGGSWTRREPSPTYSSSEQAARPAG
jgi:hypothetical protein